MNKPRILPLPDDDDEDNDSDDSDKKSKMSFSYWGADRITLQKPVLKPKQPGVVGSSTRRISPVGASYGRESSANAKFGSRLISADQIPPAIRATTKRAPTVTSTRTRVNLPDDSHSVKATVTRPAWDTSTRSNSANNLPKRQRQTSQTSTSTARPTLSPTANNGSNTHINGKPEPSPVASEDSGLKLYRQITAQDPTLNQ